VLHHIGDLSVLDIAGQEGLPEGTVKSTLHRARDALARHLAGQREENSSV
jgi:RNA polymerase sigma-70 factor (ECF subfamily)